MVLRTVDQELVLKVPRELRQELDGLLRPDATITVHGEEVDDEDHRHRFVVSMIEIGAEHRRGPCVVRVCSKKNCWKQGGREMAHLIETEIEAAGLDDAVRLKLSGCLDCCKYAPTIACNEHVIDSCDRKVVAELIERLKARFK